MAKGNMPFGTISVTEACRDQKGVIKIRKLKIDRKLIDQMKYALGTISVRGACRDQTGQPEAENLTTDNTNDGEKRNKKTDK